MKLAIAFVAAALSLAACAEEPTNLGGAHGIGAVKGANATDVYGDTPLGTSNFEGGGWIENLTVDKLKEACAACDIDAVKLHYTEDGVEKVDLVDADLKLICHLSSGPDQMPCDLAGKKW